MSAVLQVRDLRVSFRQDGEVNQAVKGVSFSVARGETVALVGESGSGKSVSALSTVSLLGDSAIVEGSVTYDGVEMVGADEKHLMQVRGNDISFIFQEPMTSLNPLHTIEKQLAESLALHQGLQGQAARDRVLELLQKVSIFFAGSLIIETIFSLDGLGRLGFEAAVARDYPVMFGTMYIFGLMSLVVGIISDLMYVLVDPRIDFEKREG